MQSKLLHLLEESNHQLNLCISFVVLWVASCDGKIGYSERRYFFSHMISANKGTFDDLLEIVESRDINSFIIVCKLLIARLDNDSRKSLLKLSIGIAVSDQQLSVSENHLLRLLADVMGYSAHQFNLLYISSTGNRFVEPGDPGSITWWRRRKKQHSDERYKNNNKDSKRNISYDDALSVLGLHSAANAEDIRRAYKRLVQTHHPDRVNSLGLDAAETAHQRFIAIQHAYKLLRK